MDIDSLCYDPGATTYYDPDVRNSIDDHMTVLRSDSGTSMLNVAPQEVIKFRGDLYGLFTSLGIKPQYHYCVRRMNQLPSAFHVPEDLAYLFVPDYKLVDRIRQAITAS